MKSLILLSTALSNEADLTMGYVIGAIIAILILVYLLYSLVKPEKF
ncbi:MAG: K(+)-transporting ATPase subunit F [Bacteroidota bacterium]